MVLCEVAQCHGAPVQMPGHEWFWRRWASWVERGLGWALSGGMGQAWAWAWAWAWVGHGHGHGSGMGMGMGCAL